MRSGMVPKHQRLKGQGKTIEARAVICIAYREDEREIVYSFRELLGQGLRSYIDVRMINVDEFSRATTLPTEISHNFQECTVLLLALSPEGLAHPMMHFIAGMGQVHANMAFNLLHSGATEENVAFPFSDYHTIALADFTSLNKGLQGLADAIGKPTPRVNVAAFIQRVHNYEREHIFWRNCNEVFRTIYKVDRKAIEQLKVQQPVSIDLSEAQKCQLERWVPFLKEEKLLTLEATGYMSLEKEGIYYTQRLIPLKSLHNILTDKHLHLV
jgi:hypothetical protein